MKLRLSPRLDAVLEGLGPCALLADIGTDHGLVPIAAVVRGTAQRAIATDLRAEPLAVARRHVERAGVGDRVTLVLGDGLSALGDAPVDAVVLAGMSGTLMARLCEAGRPVLARVQQLVAQPNTGAADLRSWARASGWWLTSERMLEQRGRFFVVCTFSPGAGPDPAYTMPGFDAAALTRIGPLLLSRRDSVALRWYRAQRERLEQLPSTRERDADLAIWRATGA
ncbi:MAG: class I SAM-dependent methyltransferase [Polyangia bacterium]